MEEKNLLSYLRFTFSLLILAGLISCTSESATDLVVLNGTTMGTTYQIKFEKTDGKDFNTIHSGIDSVLKAVNMQMSTYIDSSEISKFNSLRDTSWFKISEDFYMVLKEAQRIAQITNGAYDITVGPLVNLWGFGPEDHGYQVPSEEQIEKRKKYIGYKNIRLKENPFAVKKLISEIYIDLSSIAKGFGVDKVSSFLDENNIQNYMVEIGGEVRTKGKKSKNGFWRIGIQYPDGSNRIAKVVKLHDLSMATSGDYYNFFEINGKKYSHTIDPRTGKPVEHNLVSVSVITSQCMSADGLATALLVLGPVEGFNFALKEKLPVIMFINENEKFVEKFTPDFNTLIENSN